MADAIQIPFSGRLRQLTEELRSFDLELKSGVAPELGPLQEFRHVLDNARMTAWTVGELLSARESQRNPAHALSFLAAERLRRTSQMLRDLSENISQQEITWQTNGVQALFDSVNALQIQLSKLIGEHRQRFGKVGDSGC
ncbi:MAG TPA: hypothetical protein VFB79_19380 [Candidatus Angelobacter sp.]|nr:hypothetical protein [Candidatus Angelobacter sp.]